MMALQPLRQFLAAGACPDQYTSVRLQVDRITTSATPLSCRRVRKAATSRSSLNATFSRSATGAVLWLIRGC